MLQGHIQYTTPTPVLAALGFRLPGTSYFWGNHARLKPICQFQTKLIGTYPKTHALEQLLSDGSTQITWIKDSKDSNALKGICEGATLVQSTQSP